MGFLDNNGLARLWQHINLLVDNKVDKVSGKGLSTNDYTTKDKNKLANIEDSANKTIVDSELDSTSTNPVQNKVVKTAISNLNTLVGDTSVSKQISTAIAEITPSSIGAATTSAVATAQSTADAALAQSGVSSVNGETGAIILEASDVNAASVDHTHKELITSKGKILLGYEAKTNTEGFNHYLRPDRAETDTHHLGSRSNYWDSAYLEKITAPSSGTLNIDSNLSLKNALDIPNGGTGATTPEAALANLGAAPVQHEHSIYVN
jgi:hypothetical protein